MRLALAFAAVALFASSVLAEQPEEPIAAGGRAVARAEAEVHVAFASGKFKPRPPELKVVDSVTGEAVAKVRPREWTLRSATYTVSLPVGHRYGLHFALPGEVGSFARLSMPVEAEGTVIYRVPYAPASTVAAR